MGISVKSWMKRVYVTSNEKMFKSNCLSLPQSPSQHRGKKAVFLFMRFSTPVSRKSLESSQIKMLIWLQRSWCILSKFYEKDSLWIWPDGELRNFAGEKFTWELQWKEGRNPCKALTSNSSKHKFNQIKNFSYGCNWASH